MRIISGIAGGIPLKVPKGVTRPTADRVRESLFATLGNRVTDARVLDLFAGSGALGLESLSRGATHASFVERNRAAAETLKENLEKSRLGENASLQIRDALAITKTLAPATYDIIFADPPYVKRKADRDFAEALLKSETLALSLKPGGLFILETESRTVQSDYWKTENTKTYGDTTIHFLTSALNS